LPTQAAKCACTPSGTKNEESCGQAIALLGELISSAAQRLAMSGGRVLLVRAPKPIWLSTTNEGGSVRSWHFEGRVGWRAIPGHWRPPTAIRLGAPHKQARPPLMGEPLAPDEIKLAKEELWAGRKMSRLRA